MGKTIYLNEEQFRYLREIAKQDGKLFMKHMPDSSDFAPKKGSWKDTWIEQMGDSKWPKGGTKDEEFVGCHVVDTETKKVYLYPKPKSENSSIIDHENDSFFLAEKALLVPFNLSDATYKGPAKSPEEGLKAALSKISSL